ncbi:MAG: protein kinase [Candidatus Competibacterales bacterium]
MNSASITIENFPNYTIQEKVGQGGMAVVYRAIQKALKRTVALKVIYPQLAANEKFTQRFFKEGEIIAQLNHSHIVTVYDIGRHQDYYYLSMEWLPGGTLAERIEAKMPIERVLQIAKTLADALDYAHNRNIIHRDIKPMNILFREDESPVLTDFGIAKMTDSTTSLTIAGAVVGTPKYMSPEQALGQPIDARSDLYSFGIVFYEMLTGEVPYKGDSAVSLALKHCSENIPMLPPHLARFQPVINRLLAKKPDERYPSGAAFIEAINRLDAVFGDDEETRTGPVDLSGLQARFEAAVGTDDDLDGTAPKKKPKGKGKGKAKRVSSGDEPRRASRWVTPVVVLALLAAVTGGGWYLGTTTGALQIVADIVALPPWGEAPDEPQRQPSPQPPPSEPGASEPTEEDLARMATLESRIEQLLADNNLSGALILVQTALEQYPGHGPFLALEGTINAARREQTLADQVAQNAAAAEQHLSNGDLINAWRNILDGLEVAPDNAPLQNLRQQVQRAAVGQAQALKTEAETLLNDQGDFEAANERVQQVERLVSSGALPAGRVDFGVLTREIGELRTRIRRLLGLAEDRVLQERREEALDLYRQVLAVAPNNDAALAGVAAIADYYWTRAQGERQVGRTTDAQQSIELALAADPDNEAYRRFGREVEEAIQRDTVRQVLELADRRFAAGQWLEPPNESALLLYQAALQQDPDNIPACRGLFAIQRQLGDRVRQLLSDSDTRAEAIKLSGLWNRRKALVEEELASCTGLLGAGATSQNAPSSPQEAPGGEPAQPLVITPVLDGATLRRIEQLLERADYLRRLDRLRSPASGNAFDTYRQVLSLDPNNATAQQGLNLIAERYVELARIKVRQGARDQAIEFVRRGLGVVADHPQLVELAQSLRPLPPDVESMLSRAGSG